MKKRPISVVLLCSLLLPCVETFPQALVTSLVKDLDVGPMLEKVFDKFLQDKTPKEAARPKVRELYASLLDVKARREALSQAIDERVKILRGSKDDVEALALSKDSVISSAADAKTAFLRLQKAFTALNVDIDSTNPELTETFGKFTAAQTRILDRPHGHGLPLFGHRSDRSSRSVGFALALIVFSIRAAVGQKFKPFVSAMNPASICARGPRLRTAASSSRNAFLLLAGHTEIPKQPITQMDTCTLA